MDEQAKTSIVRICKRQGSMLSYIGCGFLANSRSILTCWHVVRETLFPEKDLLGKEVELDFPFPHPSSPLKAKVVHVSQQPDLALLELLSDLPETTTPMPLSMDMDLLDHPYSIYGITDERSEGNWTFGLIRSSVGDRTIQLEGNSAYKVERGFSGAAVWDKNIKKAVGMLVNTESDKGPNAAYAIPMAHIKERLSHDLSSSIKLPSRVLPQEVLKHIDDFTTHFEDSIDNFEPREWLVAEIDKFINDCENGYFILEAEAGLGKTCFLARLAKSRGYIQHFIIRKPNNATWALKNLVAQLIERGYLDDDIDRTYNFERLLSLAAKKIRASENKKIIIIIDALDEAEKQLDPNENVLGLPYTLQKSVYIIVSQRPGSTSLKISPDTCRKPFPLTNTDPNSKQDIEKFLDREYDRLKIDIVLKDPKYSKNEFAKILSEKAAGVWIYLHFILKEIEYNNSTKLDLEALPRDLTTYYYNYWSDRSDPTLYLPLIASLAVIQEAVTRNTLACFSYPDRPKNEYERIDKLLNIEWRPFISVKSPPKSVRESPPKYSFYHITLCEFFKGNAYQENEESARKSFMRKLMEASKEAHDRISKFYYELLGGWDSDLSKWQNKEFLTKTTLQEVKLYGIKYLAYHLKEADRDDDLKKLLLNFYWLKFKLDNIDDVAELIRDYDYLSQDEEVRLVQSALQLSIHVLKRDKEQLISQLYGRLISYKKLYGCIRSLMLQIERYNKRDIFWLKPISPGLIQAGQILPFKIEDQAKEISYSQDSDDRRVISVSDDLKRAFNLKDLDNLNNQIPRRHVAGVNGVAISNYIDKLRAISASYDHTLRVWDLETGKELAVLLGHTAGVNAVAVTPDGKKAISASDDGTVVVWNLENYNYIKTLSRQNKGIKAVTVTKDGRYVISASYDGSFTICDLTEVEDCRMINAHNEAINTVVVTQENDQCNWHIITGSHDQMIRIWSFKTGALIKELGGKKNNGHTDRINSVAITNDGQYIISASHDKTIKKWDIKSCAAEEIGVHELEVNSVVVTPDGRIISASHDSLIKIWDPKNRLQPEILTGHEYRVNAISLYPDGKHIISASYDGSIKIWDLEASEGTKNMARINHKLNGVNHRIRAISVPSKFANDAELRDEINYVVSASYDHTLKVWSLRTGDVVKTFERQKSGIKAVDVTPNGDRAISGSYYGEINIWDIVNLEGKNPVYSKNTKSKAGRFSVADGINLVMAIDNKYAISGTGNKGLLNVWDLQSGEIIDNLTGHKTRVYTAVVTPDRRRIISGDDDGIIFVRDLDNGIEINCKQLPEPHKDWVSAVAITKDGKRAVSASYDKTLKVWDLENHKMLGVFEGHSNIAGKFVFGWDKISEKDNDRLMEYLTKEFDIELVKTAKFERIDNGKTLKVPTPNNVLLLKLNDKKTEVIIEINNIKIGKFIARMENDERNIYESKSYRVNRVAITQDDKYVVSASDQGTVLIWSIDDLKELNGTRENSKRHDKWVSAINITSDERYVVTASYDCRIILWDIKMKNPIAYFTGDSPITDCITLYTKMGLIIIAGDEFGQMHFLHLEGANN